MFQSLNIPSFKASRVCFFRLAWLLLCKAQWLTVRSCLIGLSQPIRIHDTICICHFPLPLHPGRSWSSNTPPPATQSLERTACSIDGTLLAISITISPPHPQTRDSCTRTDRPVTVRVLVSTFHVTYCTLLFSDKSQRIHMDRQWPVR